jgi:hypothetical protein
MFLVFDNNALSINHLFDLYRCLFTSTIIPLLYCITLVLSVLKRTRTNGGVDQVLKEGNQISQGQTGFSQPGGWL